MKKILFTLGLLALPSIASADFFGFLDRSATRDTVSIPIKITDSLGSPAVLVSGDSVYITVYSPGGTVVFVDSMAFNDASINSYVWEDFTGRDYVYTERISVLDGASTAVGMFTLFAHTQNLTSAALEDQKSTSFYIGDNLWNSLLANLDASITSRTLPSATYFDPVTDAVANVSAVNGIGADVITATSFAASTITEILDSLFTTRVDADTATNSFYGSLLNDLTAIRDSLQFLITATSASIGQVSADVTAVSGSVDAADSLEAGLDGYDNADLTNREYIVAIDGNVVMIEDTVNAIIDTVQARAQDNFVFRGAVSGTPTAGDDSTVAIDGDIPVTKANDYFNDMTIVFTTGAHNGKSATFFDWDGTNDSMHFKPPLGTILADNDSFVVMPQWMYNGVWRAQFPSETPVAGSWVDSGSGWGATSAGGLDSQIVSNIVHRVANGTPKGSGSDSSTLAERDGTVAAVEAGAYDSTAWSDSTFTGPDFATNWYDEFATPAVLRDTILGTNINDVTFLGTDTSYGEFVLDTNHYQGSGAAGIDSQTVSNIMHRVGWGTPKGSGSDSSTLAERDVQVAGINNATIDSGNFVDGALRGRHFEDSYWDSLANRSDSGSGGGGSDTSAIKTMLENNPLITGLGRDAGNLVRNSGFERDSALANTAPEFWVKGDGTHTLDESQTSTSGGRWQFHIDPSANETSFVYQYIGEVVAGHYWLSGAIQQNTNTATESWIVLDNVIPTTTSIHIDSVGADTNTTDGFEYGKIVTLAAGDIYLGMRVNNAALGFDATFDNIKLISLAFDTSAYQGAAGSLDSGVVSRVVHRIANGTPQGSGSDSSTLAERDATVAAMDNDVITAASIAAAAIGSSELATNAIGSAQFAASAITEILDSLFNTRVDADTGSGSYYGSLLADLTAIRDSLQFLVTGGAGSVDSQLISNIMHRVGWGTPKGSGSDSSTQAERDVTGTSDILSYMDTLIYSGAIWVNAAAANTNTVIGTDGTSKNPVSTFAAARTLADALGTQQYNIVGNGTLTLAATHEEWVFNGINRGATIALGGQDVDLSVFRGVAVSGAQGGTQDAWYIECELGLMSTVAGHFIECALMDTIGVRNNADIFFDACHSTAAGLTTPTIDFGVATTNVSIRHYSGGVRFMDASSNDTINVEGEGQIIVSANSANVNLVTRGHFTITDSSTGTPNFTVDALFTRAEADLWVWANADTSGSVDTSDIGAWLVNNLQTSVAGTGAVTVVIAATDTSGTDTTVSGVPLTLRDLAGNQIGLNQFTNTDGYTTWSLTEGDSMTVQISGTVHNSHIWQSDADTFVVPASIDTFGVGTPTAADSLLMGFDVPVSTPSAANTCVITLHLGDIDGIVDNEDLFGRKVTFTLPGKHIDTCADPVSIITNVSKTGTSDIDGIVTVQLRYSNCVRDTEYELTIDHPNFTNKTYKITVPRQATYTLTADDLE